MCDNNGFTGIRELDLQIITDLWFLEEYTDIAEIRKNSKTGQAILATLNLYNTCHYFRKLLDDPIVFLQFQNMIGYRLFDRFADIDSFDKLLKSVPRSTKNGDEELIKLVVGNVVSIPSRCKNYRIIHATDSCARMIEIDIKGIIVDSKIIEIFSKLFHWLRNDKPFISQSWITYAPNDYVNNEFLIWQTRSGTCLNIVSIDDKFLRYLE
jgi:hypothetical protein